MTTDSQGNTGASALWAATVQYGIAPFAVPTTDADLGTWHYTFDALGEVAAWTDAKGQNFLAKYDLLSRMTDRYEPDLYSRWTWGTNATAHDIGRLESVCTGTGTNPTACTASTGYAENETYDSAGRLNQRSITIPGDATYTYAQTYNADGLPDTVTYPVSTGGYALALKYGYAYGLLNSIKDTLDNVTLWAANTLDARGQYAQETFGNGVVVTHAFDPITGLPQSITAGVGGGATLQNNSYLFDAVGNLIQRQDNNAGTTESVYPDSLNRLSYTVGDTNTHVTYDSIGRISTWEASGGSNNVNDYMTVQPGCTYYSNAQPHAVREKTQASWNTSFCYDADGNLTRQSSNGVVQRSIAWTSFNQPSAITAGSSYSDFYYDENHQRFEQIASYSGSSEDTEYIGGLMEKMTNSTGTAYRYYIPAGNNFIIYNRWTNGTNAIDYATKDNIGSTGVITDSTGALVVAEKFAALGWNENTSTQEATMASITRHEFTGQEGLDNSGLWLVNMNGRIYNPSGATFYSPDPYIQDPTNTQNYDRYSYVFNNPLTYIDPSGFDCTPVYVDSGAPPVAYKCDGVTVTAPPHPTPDVCIACFYTPEPQSPMTWPSTFPALVGVPRAQPPKPSPTTAQQQGKPHFYQVNTWTSCTPSEALNMAKAPWVSAPGAPQAQEGTTGPIVLWGNNPITQTVDSSSGTIVNTTLPTHTFYPGTVTFQVAPALGNTSTVVVTGQGTGNNPEENDAVGIAYFGSALSAIATQCAVIHGAFDNGANP